MSPAAGIAWLPWSAAAFARARSEGKPVLLSIAASWCHNCEEMDHTSYTDPAVVSLVAAQYIPIRVDADRRPDLSQRYGLGGWPTTAFLTPDGAILAGGTFVDPARLSTVLQRVSDAFLAGRHALAGQTLPPPRISESPAVSIDELIVQINRAFDPVHGGFGESPKFPHVAPVRLALDTFRRTQSDAARDIAVKSLDAMGWGPLYDEQNGGFFRYSSDADWGQPNEEKLLDVNAALLSLYVEAFDVLQLARYAERAEDVLRYAQTWLADPVDGGWAGSQRADPGYYADRSTESTGPSTAPPVDRTLYVDWNALMVSAALHAGRVMNDTGLSEFAIRSLERVVLLCYHPGAGVAHYFDRAPEIRGLLDDQIVMAVAQLDAFDATGNIVYEMMAEELVLYATRTMWDEEGGGFFDRAVDEGGDVGLLRERLKPFASNCVAARMLARLAKTSGTASYADYAQRTLTAMAVRAPTEGLLAAEYVLAVRSQSQ
jgi:uncharacterized protein YyaL (SSP411 family)